MSFWAAFLADQDYVDDRAILAAIQYQVTTLLESEAPLVALNEQYPTLRSSNFSYGVDSIQSISSQVNKDQLAVKLVNWIKAFEPRLKNVSVEVFEPKESSNAVEFSLSAELEISGISRALLFDSNINLANQKVGIEGQDIV